MPYNFAGPLQYGQPVSSFIGARDNATKNALFQQQAADQQANAEANRQNLLFEQNRQTASDQRQAQQDQIAAQARAQSTSQDEGKQIHSAMQALGAVANDPVKFQGLAQRILNHPTLGPALAKHGVTQEDMTPANVQELLASTGAETGQAPPVTYTTADGPRGSRIQTDSTGKSTQLIGPDNSQPKPEAAVNPESVESTAQMIANNQIPMLSGYALKSPWGQAVVGRVRELNPQFAGADYGANAAGIKQFTSGKNGNTIRSLNVAVQHLDQLGVLAQALGDGDVPAVNRVANWWKSNTGQAAPTNFNAAKKIVADEIVKAIVGSGGGVADREEASKSITAAGSPAQLAQVIETYQGLMTGQLNGLRQQYQTATGRDNFETLLLPETRAKLEAHGGQEQQVPTATGPNGQKLYLRNGQWVPK